MKNNDNKVNLFELLYNIELLEKIIQNKLNQEEQQWTKNIYLILKKKYYF